MASDPRTVRVLVTGGGGFLGQAVVEALRRRGYERLMISRRGECDLREWSAVERFFSQQRPELVVHLAAAVAGIGGNRQQPGRLLYDNALMGLHVIEACRRWPVQKVVTVGSVCAYPKHTPVPFREDDLWNGYPEETNAPYGIAKRLLLVQAQAYRQQYGLQAVYLLMTNVYGPRDNFDLETSHVIPALIRKCCEARQQQRPFVECWGDGTPTREFLYVEDAAEAITLALERYEEPEPLNIGSGQEVAIRDVAVQIARLTRFQGELHWNPAYPNGQPRRWLEISKAREVLGFVARTPLEEGLRRTIAWYQTQQDTTQLIRSPG